MNEVWLSRSRKFGKFGVGVEHLTSDSATLVCTQRPITQCCSSMFVWVSGDWYEPIDTNCSRETTFAPTKSKSTHSPQAKQMLCAFVVNAFSRNISMGCFLITYQETLRRTGRHFTGGAEKICPETNFFSLTRMGPETSCKSSIQLNSFITASSVTSIRL